MNENTIKQRKSTCIKIRRYSSRDLIRLSEITNLLKVSYEVLTPTGMTATVQQTDETTLARISKGVAFLAIDGSQILGTIVVIKTDPSEPIPWFQKEEVYFFTQFAVRKDQQGNGVGSSLLDHAESFAKINGAEELALDTSVKALDLVTWYKNRGYRTVDYCQLPRTSYRSVVLSKSLEHLKHLKTNPQ